MLTFSSDMDLVEGLSDEEIVTEWDDGYEESAAVRSEDDEAAAARLEEDLAEQDELPNDLVCVVSDFDMIAASGDHEVSEFKASARADAELHSSEGEAGAEEPGAQVRHVPEPLNDPDTLSVPPNVGGEGSTSMRPGESSTSIRPSSTRRRSSLVGLADLGELQVSSNVGVRALCDARC